MRYLLLLPLLLCGCKGIPCSYREALDANPILDEYVHYVENDETLDEYQKGLRLLNVETLREAIEEVEIYCAD